jgi:hypothetical protein
MAKNSDDAEKKVTRFGPGGAFAYRRGELIVPKGQEVRAEKRIKALGKWRDRDTGKGEVRRGSAVRFTRVRNTLAARNGLAADGIPARLNHVLFATGGCGCGCHGCGPHPSTDGADAFYEAHPFYSNPFYSNPFYSNPFYSNPFYSNPFYSNPFYSNPFYSNPFYSNVEQNPGAQGASWACDRKNSAKPAAAPELPAQGDVKMRVGVIDTGYAKEPFAPGKGIPKAQILGKASDVPDVDLPGEPGHGSLDPVAGHGTFVAGIVEQHAPGSTYFMHDVVSPCGEADEKQIGDALEDLIDLGANRPQFVNISLAGYSPFGMETLADAIAEARAKDMVVVASAGNDATCYPAFPAALPSVIGVGALDDKGKAAGFTNYGPWVDASTLGVDVTSTFFDGYAGSDGPFAGGAAWSGTSFAAPRVVGLLAAKARQIHGDPGFKGSLFDAAAAAVDELVTKAPVKKAMLGAILA